MTRKGKHSWQPFKDNWKQYQQFARLQLTEITLLSGLIHTRIYIAQPTVLGKCSRPVKFVCWCHEIWQYEGWSRRQMFKFLTNPTSELFLGYINTPKIYAPQGWHKTSSDPDVTWHSTKPNRRDDLGPMICAALLQGVGWNSVRCRNKADGKCYWISSVI